jgi:GH43 family beta-xylosidase
MVSSYFWLVTKPIGGQIIVDNPFKDSRPICGQDPHITKRNGELILCESEDEKRICLSYLTAEGKKVKQVVWEDPDEFQVWAPELHQIYGLWFIYYSASDGCNKNHRTKVIGAGMNPFGKYLWSEIVGEDIWGIDMTTFEWDGKRYAVWSGWEDNETEFPQNLYIAPMASPIEIGPRTLLCSPTYDWEKSIAPINEGPQAFVEDGRLYLLFSGNASWTQDYSTGILELIGVNPLNPWHWIKCPRALMTNAGHGHILDDRFWFHRKMSTMAGWTDREIISVPKEKLLGLRFKQL